MATVVSADWVLGYDAELGSHVEIRDGAVRIEDGLISAVGTRAELPAGSGDELIELDEALLMPGLIDLDALTDIDHLILDSWFSADHSASLQWSAAHFADPKSVFTPAERRQVRRYALAQLALHGITSYMPIASEVHSDWAETREDFLAMARESSELGLRGFLGPSFRSGVTIIDEDGQRTVRFAEAKGEAGFADALAFLDDLAELADPLLTGVLLPCRIETMSLDLLRQVAAASAERDVLVRLHALQGLGERAYIEQHYGCTPLELIERVGLLNERLLVPHGVVLDVHPEVAGQDTGDLATLARAGVSIIHCPLTNARYGHLLEKFSQYRQAGINLTLGTDSFPPDLIRGIDAGVQTAKVQGDDLSGHELPGYIEAATVGGARALRRPDLGRIAPGAQADLSAFSLADPRMGVTEDPIRILVLNGTARDAVLTMVAGRVVMRDGQIPGVDLAELRATGQQLFDTLRAAYPARDHRGQDVDQLFPPVFPRR